MVRWAARLIGGFFAFIGVIGMLTPIPFGIIFFVLGLLFLIPTTPGVAEAVQRMRGRISLFDRAMQVVTDRAPYPYRRILRETEIR